MRIQKIIVKNLFGMFDHEINLNLNERITIIIGENGIGKTIILRLIKELFDNDFSKNLLKVPFDHLKITFDDSKELIIKKLNDEFKKTLAEKVQDFTVDDNFFIISFCNNDTKFYIKSEQNNLKNILKSGLGSYYESKEDNQKQSCSEPWFINLIKNINIQLIETQRLLIINSELEESVHLKFLNPNPAVNTKIVDTVEEYAKNLAKKINYKLAESASLSQSLDSTFPARLIDAKKKHISESEIKEKLKNLEDKRASLFKIGILDKQEDITLLKDKIDKSTIDEAERNVFTVYIEDVEKKLAIFDDLAQKIDLFLEIINKRFKYKKMSISKDQGFELRNSKSNKTIKPSDLSSGEQHELVLLYELIFLVKPDSLVMIDEPELSLHVAWQLDFLEDFQKISKLSQIDLLIATHSPQIINDRRDLAVVLKGN